jgi:hypothetical protein
VHICAENLLLQEREGRGHTLTRWPDTLMASIVWQKWFQQTISQITANHTGGFLIDRLMVNLCTFQIQTSFTLD